MHKSLLYTLTLLLQPDSYARDHETRRIMVCMQTQANCISVEFFATIKHSQKHKQNTSKDAEIINLHDDAIFASRFKCSNTSNDKNLVLYVDSNILHRCLNFLL